MPEEACKKCGTKLQIKKNAKGMFYVACPKGCRSGKAKTQAGAATQTPTAGPTTTTTTSTGSGEPKPKRFFERPFPGFGE